jgi:putative nucleotidyltransferase with HDIG domain
MKLLRLYVLGLGLLTGAFLFLFDWADMRQLTPPELIGILTFVALAVLSQVLAVDSLVGASQPVKSSIAFLPLLAMAVLFPPPAVALAAGGMSAVSEIVVRRGGRWYRGLFNIFQVTLAYGIGSWAFHLLHGLLTGTPIFAGGDLTAAFFSFYALAFLFFGLNIIFVSTYVALRDGERLVDILTEAAGRGGGNVFYDLLASPIALGAAYLYVNLHVAGLLMAVLPFLLIRHFYFTAIRLQKANRDLLRVLIKAIETRDPYTSGHSLRVSMLARLIAEDHGLRAAAAERIERAALLHDIGKIDAVYSNILAKEGGLTEEELAVIKTHATTGADLLQTLTSLEKEVITGVRHHHERYDGSGYPSGLAGKAIPLAARIIMLCDSVDAMLSNRPYRSAMAISYVREELQRCSGTQFDPDLVATVLRNNTLERAELLVDRAGAKVTPILTHV